MACCAQHLEVTISVQLGRGISKASEHAAVTSVYQGFDKPRSRGMGVAMHAPHLCPWDKCDLGDIKV